MQHRRRVATRDRRLERPVSLRDDEPPRLRGHRRAPHRQRSRHFARGRNTGVRHSFGGLVALAVAERNKVPLASLVILEAPAPEVLRDRGEREHYRAFREMTKAYFAAFEGGNAEAIAAMIDFYGGAGTYASWPQRVRDYAVATTPVNILDWASAYGFALPAASLAALEIPALVIRGGASHPAVQRANAL